MQPAHGNLGASAARGAWSSVLRHGTGICEALQTGLPFPEGPMLSGPCARDVLKTWHGLVHQVQSHLVQVLVATGSALGSLHILDSGGPGLAEDLPHPGLT